MKKANTTFLPITEVKITLHTKYMCVDSSMAFATKFELIDYNKSSMFFKYIDGLHILEPIKSGKHKGLIRVKETDINWITDKMFELIHKT